MCNETSERGTIIPVPSGLAKRSSDDSVGELSLSSAEPETDGIQEEEQATMIDEISNEQEQEDNFSFTASAESDVTPNPSVSESKSDINQKSALEDAGANEPLEQNFVPLSAIQSIATKETESILNKMCELQASFNSKLKYDSHKEEIINRQYKELVSYRDGLSEKVTMEIIKDLISEIDSMEKLMHFYSDAEANELNFTKIKKAFQDVSISLCDILEKQYVYIYRTEPGKLFNPKRQRVMKKTMTGDQTLDKIVKESMRSGFEKDIDGQTKIIRPEMVDVYVFDPNMPREKQPAEVIADPEGASGQHAEPNAFHKEIEPLAVSNLIDAGTETPTPSAPCH